MLTTTPSVPRSHGTVPNPLLKTSGTFRTTRVREYAELFRSLGDDDLLALADFFAQDRCVQRDRHLDLLANR